MGEHEALAALLSCWRLWAAIAMHFCQGQSSLPHCLRGCLLSWIVDVGDGCRVHVPGAMVAAQPVIVSTRDNLHRLGPCTLSQLPGGPVLDSFDRLYWTPFTICL